MAVYAFDVDDTLEVSKGPVKLSDLVDLREHGEHDFLRQLRQYIPGHDYVMVGNILGISGASDDRGAAERAGWRFIQESEFAKGVR